MTESDARLSTHSAAILAQYETLRSTMLGEAIHPGDSRGLITFLHQGMWGWACTLAARTARQEPTLARSPAAAEPSERRAVIYVLAGMAMTINDRRTP